MLSLETLESIQSECLADDLPIDFERMRLWSEHEARRYFEGHSPPPSPKEPAPAAAAAAPPPPPPPATPPLTLCTVTDMHVEHAANLQWLSRLPGGAEGSAAAVSREKPRGDSAAAGAGIPLEDLAKKVGETYARCGFDYDPTMSTVQMLTQIESKLERCLAVADEMPAAYVRESEKAREKERRAKQRTEKAAIDLAAAEEKAKRSLERSMSQVAKKVGKPLMTRSQPPSRKKKVVKEQLTEEEAELRAFLATDF